VPWSNVGAGPLGLPFHEEQERSQKKINLPPIGSNINLFPWIIWHIWIARNQLLFENRKATPTDTLSKAISAARQWITAQQLEQAHQPKQPTVPTQLRTPMELTPTTLICNTDASWKADSKKAGLGWIFTNQNLQEIDRGSQLQDHVSSALLAECLAVRAALFHAISLDITHIWLRSDSQVLIKAINENRRTTELYGTLSDISSLVSSFTFCRFSFTPRLQNGPADSIARACLCNGLAGP
ncbi:PREDICTED: uncharacterized protein LOC106321021, partial [Brassica oleracea var. oleracea]|uniref:uncharacterized protein LOC106321021 n=1 Tax=Brassica oleracea var. oleracea TaxID=109376 RepID=UPI0006A724D5